MPRSMCTFSVLVDLTFDLLILKLLHHLAVIIILLNIGTFTFRDVPVFCKWKVRGRQTDRQKNI